MLPLPIQAQLAQLASPPAPVASVQPPPPDPMAGYGYGDDTGVPPAAPAPAAPQPPPGAPEGQGPGPIAFAPQGATAGAGPALNLTGITLPARTAPAAWVPQHRQTETQQGVQFSPETQAALQAATASGQQVDVDAQKAFDEKQRYDHVKALQDDAQATTDQVEYQRQKDKQELAQGEQWQKVQNAKSAMDEALANGVDQHHWWNTKSTGAKIAMGIGAIAAGWNQGTRGGSNPVLDQINKGIEQDIDAQKSSIEGKEKSFNNATSMYGLLRQKGLDDAQAVDGARLLAHQQLDAQLKAAMPTAQSSMAKLQLTESIAANQAKIAQLRAGFDEKSASKSSTSSAEAFRPAQGAGGPADILKDAREIFMKNYGKDGNTWDAAVRQAVRGRTGKDVMPGAAEPVIKDGKGGAGAARALAKPAMAAQANISDLERLKALAGNTIAGPQTQAQYDQIAAKLKANGIPLPESSTILSRASGSTQAAIDAAIAGERARLKAAQDVATNGVGGVGIGGGEEESPDTFEE